MITRSVSANHMELETEDGPELLRIAHLFGVNLEGLVKVSLIFVREGLTDESCYERFQRERQRELAELDDQLDWTQP